MDFKPWKPDTILKTSMLWWEHCFRCRDRRLRELPVLVESGRLRVTDRFTRGCTENATLKNSVQSGTVSMVRGQFPRAGRPGIVALPLMVASRALMAIMHSTWIAQRCECETHSDTARALYVSGSQIM